MTSSSNLSSSGSQQTLWELRLQKATRSGLIRIRNETQYTLLRESLQPALFGEYAHVPAETIAAQEEIKFGIISRKIMTGTECEVAFVDKNRPHLGKLSFHTDVNYIGDNRALSTFPSQFTITTTHNGINAHLFEVTYVVRDSQPPPKPTKLAPVPDQQTLQVPLAKSPRTVSERVAVASQDWKQQMKRTTRSVFVAVNNRTKIKFVRRMCDVYHGTWRRAPPEVIEPNGVAEWGSESNAALTGTDGRAVYEAEGNANITLVLAWDLSYLQHNPECSGRVSDNSVVVLKFVNASHHSELVFDLQPNDGYGKPVFGYEYAEIVKGHDGMVMPRPLLDVVNQITRQGATPANRGLFKGIPSFVEVRELRTGVIVDKPLDLERFSPASLGAILKMFLVELADRPLAPLLDAYGGGSDPAEAGSKEARLLLDVLLEMFASVCTSTSETTPTPTAASTTTASIPLPPPPPAGSVLDPSTPLTAVAPVDALSRPLTSHEISIIFAPIFAWAPSDAPRETLRQMDDALRQFREHVAVVRMLIEMKLASRKK